MAKQTPRPQTNDASRAVPADRPVRAATPAADLAADEKPRARTPRTSPGGGSAVAITAEPDDQPDDEQIRLRAYELYLERGGGHGMDFDDWLRAEQELKRKR